jgi:hypothetical protein
MGWLGTACGDAAPQSKRGVSRPLAICGCLTPASPVLEACIVFPLSATRLKDTPVRPALLTLLFSGAAALAAPATAGSFVVGAPKDEAAIRAIVASGQETVAGHRAADLDWENAFGVRYGDLAKREAFYGAVVAPLQTSATDTILETRVRFLTPTVAIVDTYKHLVGQLDIATHVRGPDRWIRATDILKKDDGAWTIVAKRIADLRYPWYRHYDAIPAAAALPPGSLSAYAGAFVRPDGGALGVVSVAGDHLVLKTERKSWVVVPTSTADFLAFDPNDLAEYQKIHFTIDKTGQVSLAATDEAGDPILTAVKVAAPR